MSAEIDILSNKPFTLSNNPFTPGSIEHYLHMLNDIHKHNFRVCNQALRTTWEDVLLKHGKHYHKGPQTFLVRDRRKIGYRAHECFRNAAHMAMDSDLTYVEGNVLVYAPIHHAWCVDEHGIVVDPTLRGGDHVADYFGIEIDTELLMKVMVRTRMYGVLWRPETAYLLDNPEQLAMGGRSDGWK